MAIPEQHTLLALHRGLSDLALAQDCGAMLVEFSDHRRRVPAMQIQKSHQEALQSVRRSIIDLLHEVGFDAATAFPDDPA